LRYALPPHESVHRARDGPELQDHGEYSSRFEHNLPHRLPFSARWRYSAAALVVLAGIALRIHVWYFPRSLWVDEEMVLLNVRDRAFAELGGALWLDQSAPVGWLALQRVVMLAFGLADRTGRAVPLLFSVATIAVAFWAGRRWLGPVGATIFVLLCSFAHHITHYTFEAKQYSADVFGALLLLALGAWALEPAGSREAPNLRRIAIWWGAASVAHWFSYGATFVTPGCALILIGVMWRRADWTRAVQAAAPGALWAASFALNYWWSIQHTLHSDYLQSYWLSAFPPADAGALGTAAWLSSQFEPLALDPGGTRQWIAFWILSSCGIAIATAADAVLGLLLLSAPLSAFLLGALRLVPLSGRLSLWILPALYAGIAITAERVARLAARSFARREQVELVLTTIAGAIIVSLCFDIYQLGKADLIVQPETNHDHNDRQAVRFLMTQRERGDVLLTTHLTLPAVWWYGGVSVAPPNLGRMFENDGGPIFEIWHEQSGVACGRNDFKVGLTAAQRAVVYLGLDADKPGFAELVLDSLSQLGTMTIYRGIAEKGRVVTFDLRLPPKPWPAMTTPLARLPGCVGIRPALRW
jgi:hypothetical protein